MGGGRESGREGGRNLLAHVNVKLTKEPQLNDGLKWYHRGFPSSRHLVSDVPQPPLDTQGDTPSASDTSAPSPEPQQKDTAQLCLHIPVV